MIPIELLIEPVLWMMLFATIALVYRFTPHARALIHRYGPGVGLIWFSLFLHSVSAVLTVENILAREALYVCIGLGLSSLVCGAVLLGWVILYDAQQ